MEQWFPIKNNSGSATIPPFSVVRAVGFHVETGSVVVDAPNEDSDSGLIVTGESSVLPNGFGKGCLGNKAIVQYDIADTLAFGDKLGSVSGSYKLKKGKLGWRYQGGAFLGIANAIRSGLNDTDVQNIVSSGSISCGVGVSWLGALEPYHCLRFSVIQAVGKCDCVELGQVKFLTRSVLTGNWIVDEAAYPLSYTFQACGELDGFRIIFQPNPCGPPCLTLQATEETEAGYESRNLQFACGGDQYAIFGGGGDFFCDGEELPGGPMSNRFLIKVEWGCDTVVPCCVQPVPHNLHVTFGESPDCTDCPIAGQTFTLSRVPGTQVWRYVQSESCSEDYNGMIIPDAEGAFKIEFYCLGTGWNLLITWRGHKLLYDGFNNCNYTTDGKYLPVTMPEGDCDPFVIPFDFIQWNPAPAVCGSISPVVVPTPCPSGLPLSAVVTL